MECQQPYFEEVGIGFTEALDLEGSGGVFSDIVKVCKKVHCRQREKVHENIGRYELG